MVDLRLGRGGEPIEPDLLLHAVHVERFHVGLVLAGNRLPAVSLDQELGGPQGDLGRYLRLVDAGEGAIAKNREVMGATNPANAAPGTIRKLYALSIGENTVHGSDAPETAKQEIAYWFRETEIQS